MNEIKQTVTKPEFPKLGFADPWGSAATAQGVRDNVAKNIKNLELSNDFYRTYTDPISYCSD